MKLRIIFLGILVLLNLRNDFNLCLTFLNFLFLVECLVNCLLEYLLEYLLECLLECV